jgi:hypothetical protein
MQVTLTTSRSSGYCTLSEVQGCWVHEQKGCTKYWKCSTCTGHYDSQHYLSCSILKWGLCSYSESWCDKFVRGRKSSQDGDVMSQLSIRKWCIRCTSLWWSVRTTAVDPQHQTLQTSAELQKVRFARTGLLWCMNRNKTWIVRVEHWVKIIQRLQFHSVYAHWVIRLFKNTTTQWTVSCTLSFLHWWYINDKKLLGCIVTWDIGSWPYFRDKTCQHGLEVSRTL